MELESVAKVVVLNENREVLLLTTGVYAAHPEKSHKPDLPGGMVDAGESEYAAAIREVYEESGIVLDLKMVRLGYAETKLYEAENKSVTKLLYFAKLTTTPGVTISWEHEAYEWVDFDSLLETRELRPFYSEAIAYIQNNQLV